MVSVFSVPFIFGPRGFYGAYSETPTLERHNVFTSYLHTVAFMLIPFRLFDDPIAARIYNQYLLFMLPRIAVGAVHDMDSMMAAAEDFVTTLNFDED